MSTYAYVASDPLSQIDPKGLANSSAVRIILAPQPANSPLPRVYGFDKDECRYYDEKCKQSGDCGKKDGYACNGRKCCESFEDTDANRCTRRCLIEYDKANCAGKSGEALNNCRRTAHWICYAACGNIVEAVKRNFGRDPLPACLPAANAMGGM